MGNEERWNHGNKIIPTRSWKETCVLVSGFEEILLNKNGLNVKWKRFPGSTVDDLLF